MSYFLSITVLGIVAGASFAISASGLVLTYATTGVFNVAQGAVGMFCAYIYWALSSVPGDQLLPPLLGLAVTVLVVAPAIGAVIELVFMRRIHGASVERSLMVSLGVLLLLLGLAEILWSGETTRQLNEFLPSTSVRIAGVSLTGEDLVTMGAAAVVGLGVTALLRIPRAGVAMRAVVDAPELLALSGARPIRIGRLGWMVGSMLAALAGILLAQANGSLDPVILTLVVVNCFAAAVVGRLRSLPWTVAGALALGLFDNYVVGYAPQGWTWLANADLALPMIFLFVVLLLLPQDRLRAGGPPVRDRVPPIPSWRGSLVAGAAVVVAALAGSVLLNGRLLDTASLGLIFGIAALSLVLLTGYAGRVSLCQLTFLGVGAVTMGKVAGGGSWLGVAAAVGVSAACGAVVALPTLRLRGLYLALATLAFAQAMTYIYFVPYVDNGEHNGVVVQRLNFFGVSLQSDGRQLVLDGVIFAVCLVVVLAIRRRTLGRRLVALADSPAAAATLGLNDRTTRLMVFAVSAGLAGLAGALYGGATGVVSSIDFEVFGSLELLLVLTIWGVASTAAALAAGVTLAALDLLTGTGIAGQLPYLLVGAGIVAVGRVPDGLGGVARTLVAGFHRRPGSAGAANPAAVGPVAPLTPD
jgi:branched-chain amino acid transport system permease protein